MLYQAVRPPKWSDVVGNNSVVGALRKLGKREPDQRPHSIMLKGPKGCGKTTMALLLAKDFGAEGMNIKTYNAANTRGIDTVRDVISTLPLAAWGAASKVYIFDEAHQLTPDAQKALLDGTEFTPEHCYFIFCTTDPMELTGPLRDRFTDYEVNMLSTANILTILKRACKEKDLTVTDDVLDIIAVNCDGTPRRALVLLEKVCFEDEDTAITLLLDEIDTNTNAFDVCRMLLRKPELRKKQWKTILAAYESINEASGEKIRRAFLGFLKQQYKNIKPEDYEFFADVTRLADTFSKKFPSKLELLFIVMKACTFE